MKKEIVREIPAVAIRGVANRGGTQDGVPTTGDNGAAAFRRRRPMPVSPFRDNRVDGVEIDLSIDYKNVELLRRCLNQAAKILPRRQTTLNAKRQRRLARELKRARYLALIPYVNKGSR